jgi:signal transduction histidine kinase
MDDGGRISPHRWRPRPTLRLRLTLLYGAVFLVAGAVLLTITYALVSHSPAASSGRAVLVGRTLSATGPKPQSLPTLPPGAQRVISATNRRTGAPVAFQAYAGKVTAAFQQLSAAQRDQLKQLAGSARFALRQQQSAQLGALLTRSAIALGIMAMVSVGLGWLMAGRALRPVRTMSARARGISESNLHERLALLGPDDELKELGDTFDELLGRLEAAFESQRQFVANASHELRTPITLERTLVEVALADPGATAESLRATCERVLAANQRQERLIEALLTLARSQRGLVSRRELHLEEVAAESLSAVRRDGVRVQPELGEAVTLGDPALVERLIANVVDNAVRYNLDRDGWVRVWTGVDDGLPTVRVTNSGNVISAEEAATLSEPFRRLGGNRIDGRGTGLGLSIVAAIAAAHGAALRTTPRFEGGLEVEVSFPAPTPGAQVVPLAVDVAGHS